MTQLTNAHFPIDPVTTSGDALAEILNEFAKATHSANLGTARPVQNTTGGLWVNNATSGKLKLMMSTTNLADKEILEVDLATGTVSVAGSGNSAAARTFLSGTAYPIGSVVFHDGNYYRANIANPTGTPGGSADWTVFSTGLADGLMAQITGQFVAKAGDTMTGPLIINSTLSVTGSILSKNSISAFATF